MRIRLFLDERLASEERLTLNADDYNYLANVLRVKDKTEVFAFNGKDGEFAANVVFIGKKQAVLDLHEKISEPEPLPEVELLCPLLKKDTIDLTVQKATELGVGVITLLQTERTNASHVNLQRLSLIAKEAAEQCRRVNVPVVRNVQKLYDVLDNWNKDKTLFFLDETGQGEPVVRALSLHKQKSSQAAFLVGPEGGFSPAEIKKLYDLPFAKGVVFDKHILRTETAVCAALSLWKYI